MIHILTSGGYSGIGGLEVFDRSDASHVVGRVGPKLHICLAWSGLHGVS